MAYARSPAAQTIHRILLKRKIQKPQFLLNFRLDETSQAATTVMSIAGHWIRLSTSATSKGLPNSEHKTPRGFAGPRGEIHSEIETEQHERRRNSQSDSW